MSVYDSKFSGEGDSDITRRAKNRLYQIIKSEMITRRFKTDIKFEVPATFEKKYHADLGVLFRSVDRFDHYNFFIIEIDDSSHATWRRENKDKTRDDLFMNHNGILTIRISLSKIQGKDKIEDDEKLFDQHIWKQILPTYIIPQTKTDEHFSDRNREFAILLKENSKGTKCDSCDHKLIEHDLCGCDWKHTNKSKMKCFCDKPVYRSDE